MIVLVLLVAGGGAWWLFGGSASASEAQVQLESVSSSGPSPFTAPAGTDALGVTAPPNATGELPGDTGGLYAQDPAKPSCDVASLAGQLTADPAKAAAWAQPMGIEASGIDGFVRGLSPVALRADTGVTEYGYADGQFQPYPATLQAGTAVLVNNFGEPTVKCYNGDPLGRPTPSNTSGTPTGAPWAGYTLQNVITVAATAAPQGRLVVVNPTTNTQTPAPLPPPTKTTPNPGPPTGGDGKLLLTGVHNYDGTVTLSDGRVIKADGTPLPPKVDLKHPPGSTTFADGSVREPSGLIFNKDGTERRTLNAGFFQIAPDGTITPAGVTAGLVAHWNYDGTVTVFRPNNNTGAVITLRPDGSTARTTPVPNGGVIQPDGSIKNGDGTITNPDGTQRLQRTLPDGTTLDPQGGNTPPKGAQVNPAMVGKDGQVGLNGDQAKQNQLVQQGGQPPEGQAGAPAPKQGGGAEGTTCTAEQQAAAQAQGTTCPAPAAQKPGTGGQEKGTGTETGNGTGTGTGGEAGTGTGTGSGTTGTGNGSENGAGTGTGAGGN